MSEGFIEIAGHLKTMLALRKFIKRLLKGDFVWMNPLFWPILGWILTTILVFGVAFWPSMHPVIVIPLFLFVMSLPLIGLLANFAFYKINEKYLWRIVFLYLSLMLIFANVYFLLLVFFDDGTTPFEGIHNVWTWLPGTQGRILHAKDALIAMVDSIHFSTVSITTLGYGDMLPTKWYSKLAVDIEVFLGLGVIVVGIGRYFQNNKNNSGSS